MCRLEHKLHPEPNSTISDQRSGAGGLRPLARRKKRPVLLMSASVSAQSTKSRSTPRLSCRSLRLSAPLHTVDLRRPTDIHPHLPHHAAMSRDPWSACIRSRRSHCLADGLARLIHTPPHPRHTHIHSRHLQPHTLRTKTHRERIGLAQTALPSRARYRTTHEAPSDVRFAG